MRNIYGIDIQLTKEREELLIAGWEGIRIKSMIENIREDDIVFDIGAEQGDISILLAKKCKKIVLFEPSPVQWPHIKYNFNRNNIKPLDCYAGFVSNITDERPEDLNYEYEIKNGFPLCAYEQRMDIRGFRHLHEERRATLQITLDDYCKRTGIYPNMMTIDVEGSEWNVLQGMQYVIDKVMPIIYLSVHHDFLAQNYNKYFNDIAKFFQERKYKTAFLNHDHESHFVFYKKSLIDIKEIL